MRVLLADNQDRVRSALRLAFEHEPEIEVVGEVNHVDEVIPSIQKNEPDILLIDVELASSPCHAFIQTIRENFPEILVVVMSAAGFTQQQTSEAGAHAFISKVEPPERLFQVLRSYVAAL